MTDGQLTGGMMPDRESRTLLTVELRDFGDGMTILRLAGEVDISSAHLLSTQLEKAARSGLPTVIIDASEVTFMDSTGVHALVSGKRLIHENETKIVLVTSPQVSRVLELVFPDPLFAAKIRLGRRCPARPQRNDTRLRRSLPLVPGTQVIGFVLRARECQSRRATDSVVA